MVVRVIRQLTREAVVMLRAGLGALDVLSLISLCLFYLSSYLS